MDRKANILRRAVVVLLFFLPSCSHKSNNWQYQETITCCHYYNSGRLIYSPKDPFRGLTIEISRSHTGLRIYAGVYSLSLPKETNDPTKTTVTISSVDGSFDILAERLEGGQKLLLPQDAADAVISSLLEDKTVCISIGRFKSEIPFSGFSESYLKMMHIPLPHN